MVKKGIDIFLRVKPSKKIDASAFNVEDIDDGEKISFSVPKEASQGLVNNKRDLFSFRFDRVFSPDTDQETLFNHVAKGVITSTLQGYNGTVFAYGQTGSGKTFTITGGPDRYCDRGMIPRTISYLFSEYARNADIVYTTHISYLELYNEIGYDLLNTSRDVNKLEDLPRVTLHEDDTNGVSLRGLSLNPAASEEEALNLLFLGDTNRMVAETPMNMASTRSHCIFTVYITSRRAGSEVVLKSKLHLVDLAGSERVAKTHVEGTLLKEAKYINLSLHYLEQVIIALQEKATKGRQHIPYRNSMMTSVLRDSLGGNCMTTMVATMSAERPNIDESISTCRFSQRVACIANDAHLNEETDPTLIIAKLKTQIEQLKAELSLATGTEASTEPLDKEAQERCLALVTSYIDDPNPDAILTLSDMRSISFCFAMFKDMVRNGSRKTQSNNMEQVFEPTNAEMEKMKSILEQRDGEINILVNMLKKERGKRGNGSVENDLVLNGFTNRNYDDNILGKTERNGTIEKREDLPDKKEAFDIFRKQHRMASQISDTQLSLKSKFTEAKALGERVGESRSKINHLKAMVEACRVDHGMQRDNDHTASEKEEYLKTSIEDEKIQYKSNFTRLRDLKKEIEHMQHILEKAKVKIQRDFENWYHDGCPDIGVDVDIGKSETGVRERETSTVSPYSYQPLPSVGRNKNEDDDEHGLNKAWSSPRKRDPSNRAAACPLRNGGHSAGSGKRLDERSNSVDNGNRSSIEQSTVPTTITHLSGAASRGSLVSLGPPQLTGDNDADADIMAFYKARTQI